MKWDLQRIIIGAVGALLLLWAVVFGLDKWRLRSAAGFAQGATQAALAQAGHEGEAKAHEQALASIQGDLQTSSARVAALEAKLARERAAKTASAPASPASDPAPDRTNLVQPAPPDTRDDLILAQRTKIGQLEAALKESLSRGDAYKASMEDANRRANLNEAAYKAALAANSSSRNLGRIEGLGLGIGIDLGLTFLKGRLR